ncbi:hypothetical protein HF086_017445 [Spodoptera exigua]|uniref:EGF-like domain-containing protein n=1 Tax=Spodoptera exigua TaxID=7107 RepID=A0A922SA54_SPOEX|nr:hypothetical protein HF086_017445 [Spodoptera exigua]
MGMGVLICFVMECVVCRQSQRQCVAPRGSAGATGATSAAEACPWSCGAGRCVVSGGAARCACGALFAGARCQHYRCAQHCHRRGRCLPDPAATPAPADLPPLKVPPRTGLTVCVCHPGYEGARCELAVGAGGAGGAGGTGGAGEEPCGAVTCENQGTCVVAGGRAACACAAEYTGRALSAAWAAPTAGPPASACGPRPGRTAAPTSAASSASTSVSAVGAVSCACPPAWSGERCQRPACVDAACSAHDAGNDTDDVPTAHDHTERADHADHDEHDHNASQETGSNDLPNVHIVECQRVTICVDFECNDRSLLRYSSGSQGGVRRGLRAGRALRARRRAGGLRVRRALGRRALHAVRGPRPRMRRARLSAARALRLGPDLGPATPGPTYCACPDGASCTAPHARAPPPDEAGAALPSAGSGGAWAGALLALLCLLGAVLGALYALHRRRRGAFVHARLADNVEINNPMYLAGEDELDPPHHNHTHNVSITRSSY